MKKEFTASIVLVLIILTAGFYWYEIRSAKIIKKCNSEVIELFKKTFPGREIDFITRDYAYKVCLRSYGLSE
ncbi:MAG: hypothetical protein AAB592_02820 [Patescibacteria group bacterium]